MVDFVHLLPTNATSGSCLGHKRHPGRLRGVADQLVGANLWPFDDAVHHPSQRMAVFGLLLGRVRSHILVREAQLCTALVRTRATVPSQTLDFPLISKHHILSLCGRLFYQDFVLLFNAENPSGKIPDSEQYQFLVIAAMCLAVLAGVKRIWLGIVLGRVTYREYHSHCLCVVFQHDSLCDPPHLSVLERYSDDLAKVMSRALLVGKTATLAREIERSKVRFGALDLPYYDVDQNGSEMSSRIANKENPDPSAAAVFAGVDDSARKGRIDELLGEWEEPEAQRAIEVRASLVSTVVRQRFVTHDWRLLTGTLTILPGVSVNSLCYSVSTKHSVSKLSLSVWCIVWECINTAGGP